MKCLETEDCWCAACVDRIFDPETGADIRPVAAKYPAARVAGGPIDVAWVFEGGMAQKLSNSIRCF